MDKAYINGLIILKKIEFLYDSELTSLVKNFIQTEQYLTKDYFFLKINFKLSISCGVDIDEILDRAPEHLYDDLINRINQIKILSNENLNKTKQNFNNECEQFVEISSEINRLELIKIFF